MRNIATAFLVCAAFVSGFVCAAEPHKVTFESLKPGVYMFSGLGMGETDVYRVTVMSPDYKLADYGFLMSNYVKDYPSLKVHNPKQPLGERLNHMGCLVKHEGGDGTWYSTCRYLKGHTFPVPTY